MQSFNCVDVEAKVNQLVQKVTEAQADFQQQVDALKNEMKEKSARDKEIQKQGKKFFKTINDLFGRQEFLSQNSENKTKKRTKNEPAHQE